MAARLSGMAQGVGYLIAAIGPFAVGLLHDVSNGWTVPVTILIAIALIEGVPGVMAGRARTITAVPPATVVE